MNFPLLDVFLSMMWLFLWILWIFLLVRVAGDIFRSSDLSGWGKATWLILIMILPYIGVLAYLVVRGDGMANRENERAHAAHEEMRAYFQHAAEAQNGNTASAPVASGPQASTDELIKLASLRDSGVLSDEEFARAKAKFLA